MQFKPHRLQGNPKGKGMLATQPPGARAAAGKHKKEKAVTLKNKAASKEESVKPYVQECLEHVKWIAWRNG